MIYSIQPTTANHGSEIVGIFNYYVENSFAAYPETPMPPEFWELLQKSIGKYPALVALTPNGQVAGFGFLRPFHSASSLRRTATVTYFISPEFTNQGIGSALLSELTEQATAMGIDSLVAHISSKNPPSIAFHQKNGFRECGRFVRAGRKNGQDFDIVWMQKIL